MGLSLKELKEQLIVKQGYTITPNHSQLEDLKVLVDDMMTVRSGEIPSTGSGYYSGTTCTGHTKVTDYKLSLGDINKLDIKPCACHTVNDTTGYCTGRTNSCSCNGYTSPCYCNDRVSSCSCNAETPACYCTVRNQQCACIGRGACNTLFSGICECYSRTGSCGTVYIGADCGSRTSSCGSRDTVSCTCNGRCSCNAEKRFV